MLVDTSDFKKVFRFRKINSTRLKHLSLAICKLLNLDRFNTTISYASQSQPFVKLSEILTLRQLNLKNGDKVYASIDRTHASALLNKTSLMAKVHGLELQNDPQNFKVQTFMPSEEALEQTNKFKDSLFGLNMLISQDRIKSLEDNLQNGLTVVA